MSKFSLHFNPQPQGVFVHNHGRFLSFFNLKDKTKFSEFDSCDPGASVKHQDDLYSSETETDRLVPEWRTIPLSIVQWLSI